MEREFMFGNRETSTKANSKMTTGMDMGKCIGMMAQVSKGNGSMEYKLTKHSN